MVEANTRVAHLPLRLEGDRNQQALRTQYVEWGNSQRAQNGEKQSVDDYEAGPGARVGKRFDGAQAPSAQDRTFCRSRAKAVGKQFPRDLLLKVRAGGLDALQSALSSAARSGGSNLLDGFIGQLFRHCLQACGFVPCGKQKRAAHLQNLTTRWDIRVDVGRIRRRSRRPDGRRLDPSH